MDKGHTAVLIARHGNTFEPGDILLRCGARTDLPLSTSGERQAARLGKYLRRYHPRIAHVFVSTLQRTRQTAEIALGELDSRPAISPLTVFDEIDYGPDEGKPESEVLSRIGQPALDRWNSDNVVPEGWRCDRSTMIDNWRQFLDRIATEFYGHTTLVVTSNGVARFVLYLTLQQQGKTGFPGFKLSTGALALIHQQGSEWNVAEWNITPT